VPSAVSFTQGGPMPDRTALDSSVIVAGLLSWHEHHGAALSALQTAIADRAELIVPAPALVEAYSVMTRLPVPHRLAPARAAEILALNLRDRSRVVSIEPTGVWTMLDGLAAADLGGGLTYDAQILTCALQAGARRLLTLNRRDFDRLETGGIVIIDPRVG
jgi:toxin FitB